MLRTLDFELLVNLTPMSWHAPINRKALEAGRNVWCEKPLAQDLTEAQALLVLARQRDVGLWGAPVEALPFPDAHFEGAVVTLVLCSVHDPERDLREIWRVLKPGGTLLLLEHVRAQGKVAAWVPSLLPCQRVTQGPLHTLTTSRALLVPLRRAPTRTSSAAHRAARRSSTLRARREPVAPGRRSR